MVGRARPLRIVFFGTPTFAVPSLAGLLSSDHSVLGVVTQPDRPRGRGQHVQEGPVKRLAREQDLEILQPDHMRDSGFVQALSLLGADLGVVAAYGKILSGDVLATPRLGFINVHASLLPKYRGAAPIQRAILAGERETGATIMRVVQELDAGPILGAVARPIHPDETSVELEADLAQLGARLLLEVIDDVAAGRGRSVDQDAQLATYAPRLTKADGLIDWHAPATAVHDKVRGLHPWPLASTYMHGRRIIILRTTIEGGDVPILLPPGSIVEWHGDRLAVAGAHGSVIRILQIQPEGRRPMSAREFLAGHSRPDGVAFTGPTGGAVPEQRT